MMPGGLNNRIQSSGAVIRVCRGKAHGAATAPVVPCADLFGIPCRGMAMKAKGTWAREMPLEDMPEPNPSCCWISGSQREHVTSARFGANRMTRLQAGGKPALQIPPRDGRSKATIVADRSNRAPCNFRLRAYKAPSGAAVRAVRCSNPSDRADFTAGA